MKRYYYSDILLQNIPQLTGLKNNHIYLVPPSLRYFFNKNTYKLCYVLKYKQDSNILQINSENDMFNFIDKFNRIVEYNFGDEGVLQWETIKNIYDGVEFLWWKPYWDCSSFLQRQIRQQNCWEWYSNIEKRCGFVWNTSCINLYFKVQRNCIKTDNENYPEQIYDLDYHCN